MKPAIKMRKMDVPTQNKSGLSGFHKFGTRFVVLGWWLEME